MQMLFIIKDEARETQKCLMHNLPWNETVPWECVWCSIKAQEDKVSAQRSRLFWGISKGLSELTADVPSYQRW